MFFKRKGVEPNNVELLQRKNIILNCNAKPKEEVIRTVGGLLCDSGYVDSSYIEAMIKREESFATNIGNGIAIPHGVEEAKKNIKRSGIAVMIFPEGTMWNDEPVNVVIGIAGLGDEHLDILANIAEKLSTPEAVQELIHSDVDTIYSTFTGEGR
ncbi:PTS system mannitol-specific IIA component [Mobilisporobacter senegalensis]|uniref:Mannitol-specific phosphotransferase enzyme IIA component n=1 Tax=Mobilisporobacter senegalensis TaxID=1329262 RepID=A0A3N1XV15_9FIRM|nr:PTS sugar transporter subunit IIA [Mobilisporobacter senegalensis]ROR30436.1 PTS system mannitol-specific IIA component [Mobilisporobacter senegalensis]